jgi:hypothetical protein
LEKDNESPLAVIRNTRRLSDSITQETTSMEIEENSPQYLRTASSERRYKQVFDNGHYRNFTNSVKQLPFKFFHYTRKKKKKKRRTIFDCQVINQYIQCQHFEMKGIPALRQIIQERDFICKISLKDAYVVVPIHPASRQYLSFQNQAQIYQYKTLAFGMSVSPRVFSKLMRYAIELLSISTISRRDEIGGM